MASSTEACSYSQSLTMGQAIGIGVAVGFAGAMILVTAALYLFIKSRFSAGTILSKLKTAPEQAPISVPASPVSAQAPLTFEQAPPASAYAYRTHNAPESEFTIGDRELSFLPREPRTGHEINPIERKRRNLAFRIDPLAGTTQISKHVTFEYRIRTFVSNYILGLPGRGKPIQESLFDEHELVRLAGEPANGGTWSGYISNLDTRCEAVASWLSRAMYRRMDPACPVEECLLPPEITTCYRAMIGYEGGKNDDREDMFAVWREIVYLAHCCPFGLTPAPPRGFKEGDPRMERTHAMAPAIAKALELHALVPDGRREDLVDQMLIAILEYAANSAMIFFCQPSEWEFEWVSDEPGVVVFPEIRFVWHGMTKWSRPAVVGYELA
ncbi:hypothetical protein ACHAPT_012853 [Fusarium lateritium]